MRRPVLPFDTLRDRLPKGLALLLVLATAPLLGGCTLTFGLTGAVIDHVSAQRPTVAYTLDTPPPLDTPVQVVTRDGRDEAGRWVGIGDDSVAHSLVVLDRRDGRPATIRTGDVVQIRSRPRRTRSFVPLLITGLFIDGAIARILTAQCLFGCQSNDGY